MDRVRRRLFNLAAAVSLVLCVATVVLWVRSAYRYDRLYHDSDGLPRRHWIRHSFDSMSGRLSWTYQTFELTAKPPSSIGHRGWHHDSGRYKANSLALALSDVPMPEPLLSYEFAYSNSRSKTRV